MKYSQEYPLVKEIKNENNNNNNTDNNNDKNNPNHIDNHNHNKNQKPTEEEPKRLVKRMGNSNTILSSKSDNDINTVSLIVHLTPQDIWSAVQSGKSQKKQITLFTP